MVARSVSSRRAADMSRVMSRSEEHTSELQSLRHLVCRLLLEKKEKNHGAQLSFLPRQDPQPCRRDGAWGASARRRVRGGVRSGPCGGTPHASVLFFFNDTATTEIYTLSLHDALPI